MKVDTFKYKNRDYIFLSHYGFSAKIYGRGKERILVENDRVLVHYSDPKARSVNV